MTDVLDAREYALSRIRAVFARLAHRFMIAVPLLIEDRVIGGLVIWRHEPAAFSLKR